MVRIQIHRMIEAVTEILLFVTVCALLSLVCVTSSGFSSGETVGQWCWFANAVLFSGCCVIIVCLLQLLVGNSWRKVVAYSQLSEYISWSLMFLGMVETIWGFRQLYGYSVSGNSLYVLTGSFFNPGPYGGYLAMVLPVCLYNYMLYSGLKDISIVHKVKKNVAATVGVLTFCVLPATMSRAAWISAAISCGWIVYINSDRGSGGISWQTYRKRYMTWVISLFFILILVGAGVFLLKKDSALGRLFMWKTTCAAIAKYPLGCAEGFAFAYGNAQENYFSQGTFYEWEERVAGSPEYAFNEYLELALTKGILSCILILVIIFVCLWNGIRQKRYGICGAIISLLIFSFSSYPMHIPGFIVTFVILFLACGTGEVIAKPFTLCVCLVIWMGGYHEKWRQEKEACQDWVNAKILYSSGAYKAANKAYNILYPLLKEKGNFLFEFGHSLHKSGFYEESNKYLEEAHLYNSDPMILNIIGKNYQELHCYEEAEFFFNRSVHRLPGRMYPYFLLANLYTIPEFYQPKKLKKVAHVILNKEPKVRSSAIKEMQSKVKELLNEVH